MQVLWGIEDGAAQGQALPEFLNWMDTRAVKGTPLEKLLRCEIELVALSPAAPEPLALKIIQRAEGIREREAEGGPNQGSAKDVPDAERKGWRLYLETGG